MEKDLLGKGREAILLQSRRLLPGGSVPDEERIRFQWELLLFFPVP